MAEANNKTVELWSGYTVDVNTNLLDDVDFITDISQAAKEQDTSTIISMYFALVGGQKTYDDVREHITNEKGYFSVEALAPIMEKIADFFPKAGNRAQRRSWKTLK